MKLHHISLPNFSWVFFLGGRGDGYDDTVSQLWLQEKKNLSSKFGEWIFFQYLKGKFGVVVKKVDRRVGLTQF